MLTVFSEALTGSSASDKLGRLSFAFGITQATSPDYHSFMRALQEAYRKTKSDQRGDTVLIDDLFKAILMTKSSYDTFAPLITQLDAERAVPGQPQQRRASTGQPFAMLVECFNKYYADITSRKKVAVAPTSSADRKVSTPRPWTARPRPCSHKTIASASSALTSQLASERPFPCPHAQGLPRPRPTGGIRATTRRHEGRRTEAAS
jgi:hypothetical protein